MKQHITPEQAQEITEEQFYNLFEDVLEEKIVHRSDWYKYHHKKMTIGKMIAILVQYKIVGFENYCIDFEWYEGCLCDALWETVKVGKFL